MQRFYNNSFKSLIVKSVVNQLKCNTNKLISPVHRTFYNNIHSNNSNNHIYSLNHVTKITSKNDNINHQQPNHQPMFKPLLYNTQINNATYSNDNNINASSVNNNTKVNDNNDLFDSSNVLYREPRMLDCVLVRHGESEGNIAYNKSFLGDHSLYSGAFLKRHSSLWRLTDRGREQASQAGEWIKNNMPKLSATLAKDHNADDIFDRYYVSEYIRAMETAGLMDMPDARWFVEVQLRERDWGQFDIMSQKERVVRFSEETKRRDRDSLFYAPPGGESLVHVLSRVDGILNSFNRQAANKRCLIVCHGEVMWAFRLRFERLSQLTYREMEAAPTSVEKIHNAQILHYTRQNPFTGEISPIFKWKRSVCPWDLSKSRNVWEEIIRVQHTNQSLLLHANRVKRIYANDNPVKAPSETSSISSVGAMLNGLMRPSDFPPRSPLVSSDNTVNTSITTNTTRSNTNNISNSASNNSATSIKSDSGTVVRNSQQNRSTNSTSKLPMEPLTTEPRDSTTTINHSTPPTANIQANVTINAQSIQPSTSTSSNSTPPPPPKPSIVPIVNPFLKTHPNVLVLTKTPRYEHEKNSLGLRGEDLHSELSRLGFVSDRLVQSYVRHMEGLSQLTLALQQHGMKVTVKQVDQCTTDDLNGMDLVLSAGGDGTMLKSASLLGIHKQQLLQKANNLTGIESAEYNIPLIGVNTDPQHSAGVLCAFSVEGPHTCERVLEHISRGHFVWKTKTRLSVSLVDKSGVTTCIPQFALNDILIAEKDPGRPFVYELTVDDQPSEIQRSSGVLVSTGTGSTAWMSSAAAIHQDQVIRILADLNIKTTSAEAKHIAERVNMDMIFDSESHDLQYYVREQLMSGIQASSKGKYNYRHGFAKKLMIRSLGWNANMFFDGLATYPLPKGTMAIIEIGKQTQSKLTVLSLAGSGEPFSRQ